MIDAQSEFREKLKEIRAQSDLITNLKSQAKAISDKIEKARKLNKPIDDLTVESRALELQVSNETAKFEGYKRKQFKEAMLAQAQGISKFARKAQVYATYTTHLANQVPQVDLVAGDELPDFNGYHDLLEASLTRLKADYQTDLYEVRSTLQLEQAKYTSSVPVVSPTIMKPQKIKPSNDNWADFDAPTSPKVENDLMQGLDSLSISSSALVMQPEKPPRNSQAEIPSIQVYNSQGQNRANLPIEDNPW